MSHPFQRGDCAYRRRGAVAVQVGFFMIALMTFAAFTIDLGALRNVRADLQRTADSSALAGASVFVTDDMMRLRLGTADSTTMTRLRELADLRVDRFASLNPSFGTTTTLVEQGDMQAGWLDPTSATAPLQIGAPSRDFNAIQVVVRRQNSDSELGNGPVPYLFAPLIGLPAGQTAATATAMFDDRFQGVSVPQQGGNMLPFTIDKDAFELELVAGGDQYSYIEESGTIASSPDGIREIRLYPYPLSGSEEDGAGNFGTLNIGTGNQGVDAERVQILDGITPEDFVMEIGTSDVMFYDDSGTSVSYDITGSPGLEVALKDTLAYKVGDVVGFFLHDSYVDTGSNIVYTIVGMRFGRVMDFRLTGAPSGRGLFVQPVTYVGGEVRVDADAPSSGGLVGRVVLAR